MSNFPPACCLISLELGRSLPLFDGVALAGQISGSNVFKHCRVPTHAVTSLSNFLVTSSWMGMEQLSQKCHGITHFGELCLKSNSESLFDEQSFRNATCRKRCFHPRVKIRRHRRVQFCEPNSTQSRTLLHNDLTFVLFHDGIINSTMYNIYVWH